MSWKNVSLGELFSVGSSKRVLKSQWQTSGVPFYRGREITKLATHGSVDNELFISEELFSELSQKYGVPVAGDIVITAIGTIGNSYIVKPEDRFYFKDASVLWLGRKFDIDSAFVNYWLKSSQFKGQLEKGNGATVDTLTITKLKNAEIQVPPLPEQKRIVTILDEAFEGIDTVVANTKRNFANIHELYASSLGRVFSEANVETWEKAEIKDAVAEDCSLSYGIVQPGEGFEDGMPIVRPTDLTKKLVGLKGLKLIDPSKAASYSRTTLEGGDLLLCVRGNTGMVSIAGDELAGGNVTRGIVPVRFNPELVSQSFGYYLLVSPMVQEQVKEKTYGAALMQINIRDLRRLRLAFPEIEDQRSMVKKLDDISAEVKRLEAIYQQKLTALAELKQSLLQKAFSGELTAKQAETAVAEAAA